MPAPPRPRVTAADRAQRRLRIYARLQEGWSHEAIAAEEKLSRERVRQIAKETLDRREVDPEADFVRLQMARLDPALRLAGEKVAAGEVTAIDRLLRVLDRMDKYHSAAASAEADCDAAAAEAGDTGFLDREAENPPYVDYRQMILDKLAAVDRRRAENAEADLLEGESPAPSEGEPKADARQDDVAKFAKFFQR